jgi:hypothetical protein
MSIKKGGKVLVLLLILSLFVVSCTSIDSSDDISAKGVWDDIISIGTLDFLDDEDAIFGFVRLMVALLVFAVLFEVSALLGFSKNIRIVIATILAILPAIFIPNTILAAIGGTYALVVSFILIGVPVLGGGYALYRIPSTSRPLILLKISIILLLLWLLFIVKDHALELLAKAASGGVLF